jgi:ketosteroid isomerase-like protein
VLVPRRAPGELATTRVPVPRGARPATHLDVPTMTRPTALLSLLLVLATTAAAQQPAAPQPSMPQPSAPPTSAQPAPALTPQSRKDAEREIRAAREAQNAAIAARDLDRVAAGWLDDVTVIASGGRVIRGRQEYRQAFERDSLTYRRATARVVVSGAWPTAWEEGTWEGRRRAWTGVPLLGGRYAAQWVRTPAGWRIRSETYAALDCADTSCRLPLGAAR